jgi:rod shape-determining protein MreC
MIRVFGREVRVPSHLARLVFFALLSLALMIQDHRGQQLEKIRAGLSLLAEPVLFVAALPARLGGAVLDWLTTGAALREQNEKLRNERQILQAQLQQYEALEQENQRLRGMLGSAARVADRAIVAEVMEASPEPFTRKIIVSKGSRDGVFVGQPVIDAHGVMGQVTQVAWDHARATLLTDPGHAIPVLAVRSGLRAMVLGTGDQDQLKIPYLTAIADIREGDVLVSSGMGGTFPAGYPVAQVARIVNDPNESFLAITARPAARIGHGTQALLIWPGAKPQKLPGGPER